MLVLAAPAGAQAPDIPEASPGTERPPDAGGPSGGVLVVGDSLGVGTEPYLREALPGVDITVDAETGRPSSTGLAVLQSLVSDAHDVVVFDLGTNDDPAQPQALAEHLGQARAIAGNQCLVVATINQPPVSGVSDAGLNHAVDAFVTSTPGVQVADWRGAVTGQPGLLQADGVHGTAEGYAFRAELIADAILACAALEAPPPRHPPKQAPWEEPARNHQPPAPVDRGDEDAALGALRWVLLFVAALI